MIKVLLVDDEHLIRSAIAGLLGIMDDIEIVGEFGSGEDAIRAASALAPTLAVVDLQLPGMDGIETCAKLMESVPGHDHPHIPCPARLSQERPVDRDLRLSSQNHLSR